MANPKIRQGRRGCLIQGTSRQGGSPSTFLQAATDYHVRRQGTRLTKGFMRQFWDQNVLPCLLIAFFTGDSSTLLERAEGGGLGA
ncbi:unnamed protein product [Dovyalis caffra]|uniref:Uncharacterized protein n=1 Tax=Dovyalis caffra TaxID=77055 RepID=A0AAV1R1V1_9ROSI|nr:unnamed protein product [Dovyalis caffra]